MLPDILRAALGRAFAPWRCAWRSTWLYRQFNKGRLADRIRCHPYDALPRDLEAADAILKGRFHFAGATVEATENPIFDQAAPSSEWAAALHGFDWLPAIASAGGEDARAAAVRLIGEWLERNRHYSEPSWSPAIMARRLLHLFAHGRIALANSDVLWRSKLFVSIREQVGQLARIAEEAPPGIPRLEAAAALVLAQTCLDGGQRQLEAALARFTEELSIQILPDGGHVSRSPEDLLFACRLVAMVMDGLTETGAAVPVAVRSAQDRIAPMLRFFRHGDGALARFNGGGAGDTKMISALLARDETRGQPFVHAPHSGYQRIVGGRSVAIVDCGGAPPAEFSCRAHAGTLALEFSVGAQRIFVNCGPEGDESKRWDGALRATAAHSTVTLADTSTTPILARGFARGLLGPRLVSGSKSVDASRDADPAGPRVAASHDFYLEEFGIRHSRELHLSPRGHALSGCDRLIPRTPVRARMVVPFAARFHIHPDVRVSPSQRGDILLKLPNGEGWRFRHCGTVTIEESVYISQDSIRRCDQIVLSGSVRDAPVEIAWSLEHIGAE